MRPRDLAAGDDRLPGCFIPESSLRNLKRPNCSLVVVHGVCLSNSRDTFCSPPVVVYGGFGGFVFCMPAFYARGWYLRKWRGDSDCGDPPRIGEATRNFL